MSDGGSFENADDVVRRARTSRTSSSLRERTSRTNVRSTRTRRSPRRGAARSRSLGLQGLRKRVFENENETFSKNTRTRWTLVARRPRGRLLRGPRGVCALAVGLDDGQCASSASCRRRARGGGDWRDWSPIRARWKTGGWKTASSAATIVTSLSSRHSRPSRAASGRRRLRPSSAACCHRKRRRVGFVLGFFTKKKKKRRRVTSLLVASLAHHACGVRAMALKPMAVEDAFASDADDSSREVRAGIELEPSAGISVDGEKPSASSP